ncbi:MAG: M48 family metalloprotease [Desulfotignum sp.]
MFSTVIYFLVALIIYATSELFDGNDPGSSAGWLESLVLAVVFLLICRLTFKRLSATRAKQGNVNPDRAVSSAISRLSVLALMLFGVNIYVYRLNTAFSHVRLFQVLPTLEALLFLGLFVLYLIMVWYAAYPVQKDWFSRPVSRRQYIVSQLSFSLPALLPWLCLSLFVDLIGLIPYPPLKQALIHPAGETALIVLFMAGIAVFGPVFIKIIWQCRPLENGRARSRIEAVCRLAGLRYADILIWDLFAGTMMTAGVMGLVGRFRYILVTPALLRSLNDDELAAVILHETGHVHYRHMLWYLIFFAGFIACNIMWYEPLMLLVLAAVSLIPAAFFPEMMVSRVHPILMGAAFIGVFIVYFRFVFGFFMRNFERQADLYMYRFFPDAFPLIRTFYKIAAGSRQDMERPNWHHFSIGQRIRFLEKCQENKNLILRHHRRVRQMTAVALVGLVSVCVLGYHLTYGQFKPGFDNFIAGRLVFEQLELDPENADLQVAAGDFHYARHHYSTAIGFYETAVYLAPDHVHALNNLAWLLATCPQTDLQDPERALDLAGRAVALAPQSPFVLDTYAEALFINHRITEAVAAAEKALELSRERRDYYQDQVRRFQQYL